MSTTVNQMTEFKDELLDEWLDELHHNKGNVETHSKKEIANIKPKNLVQLRGLLR